MDVFTWITHELQPASCTSAELVFDAMESQSGRSLPLLYVPFDCGQRAHWGDRGATLDYLLSTASSGQAVLDFGPGDGWPSLLLAPFVREVTGVEGSRRRAAVCTENARRLGIGNARFVYVAPGTPLPFADGSFDAVVTAASVEQSPDPHQTLRELFRVLRPGGRLRLSWESLEGYRGGQEHAVWMVDTGEQTCRLLLIDRHVDQEQVWYYGLSLAAPASAVRQLLALPGQDLTFAQVSVAGLRALGPLLTNAQLCVLTHPSGPTMVSWLHGIGFREVLPTHAGEWFAGQLFDHLPAGEHPADMAELDRLLRPLVEIVIHMAAPTEGAMITAIK
jgi:SAM-dependent methyltransferase